MDEETENKPICNPHLNKPAYITASLPCEIVKKPCEMQSDTVEETENP